MIPYVSYLPIVTEIVMWKTNLWCEKLNNKNFFQAIKTRIGCLLIVACCCCQFHLTDELSRTHGLNVYQNEALQRVVRMFVQGGQQMSPDVTLIHGQWSSVTLVYTVSIISSSVGVQYIGTSTNHRLSLFWWCLCGFVSFSQQSFSFPPVTPLVIIIEVLCLTLYYIWYFLELNGYW